MSPPTHCAMLGLPAHSACTALPPAALLCVRKDPIQASPPPRNLPSDGVASPSLPHCTQASQPPMVTECALHRALCSRIRMHQLTTSSSVLSASDHPCFPNQETDAERLRPLFQDTKPVSSKTRAGTISLQVQNQCSLLFT